jgi:hypothetical protein
MWPSFRWYNFWLSKFVFEVHILICYDRTRLRVGVNFFFFFLDVIKVFVILFDIKSGLKCVQECFLEETLLIMFRRLKGISSGLRRWYMFNFDGPRALTCVTHTSQTWLRFIKGTIVQMLGHDNHSGSGQVFRGDRRLSTIHCCINW